MKHIWKQKNKTSKTINKPLKTYESIIYEKLKELCENGNIYRDHFNYAHIMGDFNIYASIVSYQEEVVLVNYKLTHNWLVEPIYDQVPSCASTLEEALKLSAQAFFERILVLFIIGIQSDSKTKIITSLPGNHKFDVFKSKVSFSGKRKSEKNSYYSLLHNIIPNYLGNQRIYLVKLMISMMNKELNVNVYINNVVSLSLSKQILSQLQITKQKAYWIEKQYFLFVQDGWSYNNYPFDSMMISSYTKKAINLLETAIIKSNHHSIIEYMRLMCKDASLAYEIVGLIPELYTKYMYPDVIFNDQLLLMHKDEPTLQIASSQLYSYPYIEACVYNHLSKDNIDKQAINNVLRFSGNYALLKDLNPSKKKLVIKGLPYIIPDNYLIR